jgi:predicted RNA binding protein YcfA (HicA-like mRNA interferase family)
MPRPHSTGRPTYSYSGVVPETQKQWIKRLEREGWSFGRGKNHQVKMTKDGHRPITLPEHKRRAYSKGFEAALRREAGLQGGDT